MVEDDTNRIPDDADEDIPMPLSESTDANAAANESLPAREKIDMEQQHKFSVENFKTMWLLSSLTYAFSDYSSWQSSIFQGQRRRTVQWRGSVENTRMVAVGFLFGSSAKSGS